MNLGELAESLSKRLDEVYVQGDSEAISNLEREIIHVMKAWCHGCVRYYKRQGEFQTATHFAHVAQRLQNEATYYTENQEDDEE